MTLIIDSVRAREIVSRLYEAFSARWGLLREIEDLVENQIPADVKPLSRDHALFLFFTVANDHGMKSSRLYDGAKQLFQRCRDLFEPSRILEHFDSPDDPSLIDATSKVLGVRYPREAARNWYLNSSRLLQNFEGDPRCLFQSSPDAGKLLRQIRTFRGYGPKTGGMLLRAVVGLGFAKVDRLEEVLPPVDIHDSRISFFTGIVREDSPRNQEAEHYYKYCVQIQRVLRDACDSSSLAWPDVDRALWLIGSRGCAPRRCELCPLNDLCSVGTQMKATKPLPMYIDSEPADTLPS
jgi:endonuclease III